MLYVHNTFKRGLFTVPKLHVGYMPILLIKVFSYECCQFRGTNILQI